MAKSISGLFSLPFNNRTKHLSNHHMPFPCHNFTRFSYARFFLPILHTKCVINLILQTVVILWFNCRNNASISLKTTCRTKVFTTFLIMYHLITVWKICQITTWIALSTISIKLHVTISRDFFMQDFFYLSHFRRRSLGHRPRKLRNHADDQYH